MKRSQSLVAVVHVLGAAYHFRLRMRRQAQFSSRDDRKSGYSLVHIDMDLTNQQSFGDTTNNMDYPLSDVRANLWRGSVVCAESAA